MYPEVDNSFFRCDQAIPVLLFIFTSVCYNHAAANSPTLGELWHDLRQAMVDHNMEAMAEAEIEMISATGDSSDEDAVYDATIAAIGDSSAMYLLKKFL